MLRILISISLIAFIFSCNPKLSNGLRKKDLIKDVEMITDHGVMTIRLFDSTPFHRDNFLKLVKYHYYDQVLFHRVIRNFMIQAGDPTSKILKSPEKLGAGGPNYTIPAEFISGLFHKKGAIAAARQGDNVNPQKASSGSQFYIVQGKKYTDAGLDSIENYRLNGRKLPLAHRETYKSLGGAPHLDQNYTVFGEVIQGLEVIDKIASEQTNGREGGDRPLKDIRLIKANLIERKLLKKS